MKKATAKPPTQLAKATTGGVLAAKVPARSKVDGDPAALLGDLRALVQSARQRLASVANATYTLLCWQIGRRLLRDNLQGGRAAYGKQILATVSQTLSWSHVVELLPIKDPLARDFYAEMCRIERWDVRTLRQKIGGMLFQRTLLNPPKLSTALRDMQPQAEQHFHDEAELQPAVIHKEYLSVRREVARHAQRRAGKRICVTAGRELIADIGCYFKPELGALLERAPS